MARSYLIHGASVTVYVNGQKFAQCIDFRFGSATPRESIRGLDSMTPFELAQTTSETGGSITIYRQSQDGGAEGAGMTVPISELTRELYFSIALVEEHSNTVVFQADRCSIESQEWNVAARTGYLLGNISFKAIDWVNEVRPVAQPQS